MRNDKPLKCRLTRAYGEPMALAWNVSDYEMDNEAGILHLYHERGEVIHRFAPGDTVTMLEQYNPESDHENDR